jgi:hypothetical protein
LDQSSLVRRTIEVTSAVNVQTIIIGAVAGVLLLILGVVAIYMACKHRHRATQLLVSFLRRETLLALKIVMELLDISGDSTPLLECCSYTHHLASGCFRN